MARRYVRDKAGRFAPKGGSGKRGGKLSKSTAGRSAKAKYKAATSKVRKSERDFKSARKSSVIMSKKASRANWSEKATGKAMVAGDKFKRAGRARTSAKGQLTRVTNKMTKKRVAAGAGLKKNFANQAKASRAKKFRSKTTKGRAAKKEWKAAKGADRKSRSTTDSAQKRVIKKQTGKKAYSQGFRETPAKTKAPRAGSKTRSQKIRAKIDSKKFANKELRGNEFKGAKKRTTTKKSTAKKKVTAKKRTTKAPRKQKGAQAYDGPNKARSEAADRVLARTKAIRAKRGIKDPTAFSGTAKYSRQGKLSKASKGSGAKQKYKKATSELRKSKRGSSLYQQSQMGHPSKRKKGQVTRLTNKFTNKRKATGSFKDLDKKIPKKTKRSGSNKIVGFKRKKKR